MLAEIQTWDSELHTYVVSAAITALPLAKNEKEDKLRICPRKSSAYYEIASAQKITGKT